MEIRVAIEELRSKCKLFLATPMYGGMCTGMYNRSCTDLASICTNHGISFQLYHLFNESLITRARNYCCDEFMRSGATHLMFIDSDIGFNANDVLGLLALTMDQGNGYDIIGGPYPKKCISWEKIKMAVDKGVADKDPNNLENFVGDYVFNPKTDQNQISITEPCEVREIGTGFMMIQRQAMEKIQAAYPQLAYRPDHVRTEHFDGTREIHAFFDCVIDRGYTFDDMHRFVELVAAGKEGDKELQASAQKFLDSEKTSSKRYLSEDYMFCYYAQNIGLRVWFCPWMRLQHVGTYVFGGSLADLAQIGAPATADGEALKKIRHAQNQTLITGLQTPPPQDAASAAKAAAAEKRRLKAEKNKNQANKIDKLSKITTKRGASTNEEIVAKEKIKNILEKTA